jgi:hypothetical protein
VGVTELERLVTEERCVDLAVNDGGAGAPSHDADLVASECVAGMNADADEFAGRNGRRVQRLERLVDGSPRPASGQCMVTPIRLQIGTTVLTG